jgi:hypothetical protein
MSPVDVNVFGDCANVIEAWLAAPNKRSGTKIALRSELIPLPVACMSFLQAALPSLIFARYATGRSRGTSDSDLGNADGAEFQNWIEHLFCPTLKTCSASHKSSRSPTMEPDSCSADYGIAYKKSGAKSTRPAARMVKICVGASETIANDIGWTQKALNPAPTKN